MAFGLPVSQGGSGGGGGGGGFTPGADLLGNGTSTSVAQYVSSLSFDATGEAHGAGGVIPVNGTGTKLNWVDDQIALQQGGSTYFSTDVTHNVLLGDQVNAPAVVLQPKAGGKVSFLDAATEYLAIALVASVATLTVDSGAAGLMFTQSNTSAALAASMIAQPQASTAVNGTPGGWLFKFSAPTGTGTYPQIDLTVANNAAWSIRGEQLAARQWMIPSTGTAPTNGNYTFQSDFSQTIMSDVFGHAVQLSVDHFATAAACARLTLNGLTLFDTVLTDTAGGTAILALCGTNVVKPNALPTSSVLLWGNTGAPGTLGVSATGINFSSFITGSLTITQDTKTTDTPCGSLIIQAPSPFAGATGINRNGGAVQLVAEASVDGELGATLVLAGGNGATSAGNIVWSGSSIGCSAGQGWSWAETLLAIVTTGTITLSGSQISTPLIDLAVTLTGNLTLDFTNIFSWWILDTNDLNLNGHTLTLKSGTGTIAATSGKLYMVRTDGSNTIRLSSG